MTSRPDSMLVLVGSGELKEDIIKLINERSIQDKLQKKAKNIINRACGNSHGKKMSEEEINNQGDIIQKLIAENMLQKK